MPDNSLDLANFLQNAVKNNSGDGWGFGNGGGFLWLLVLLLFGFGGGYGFGGRGFGAGTALGSGALITIQQMIIRSEEDIRKISQELYNLIQSGSRAQGHFTTA